MRRYDKLPSCITVSYTHLDVYKRQVPVGSQNFLRSRCRCWLRLSSLTWLISWSVVLWHLPRVISVSYTHLDVYKRQVQHCVPQPVVILKGNKCVHLSFPCVHQVAEDTRTDGIVWISKQTGDSIGKPGISAAPVYAAKIVVSMKGPAMVDQAVWTVKQIFEDVYKRQVHAWKQLLPRYPYRKRRAWTAVPYHTPLYRFPFLRCV